MTDAPEQPSHQSPPGHRLRAVLAIGGLWALAWWPVGILVALYAAATPPQPDDLLYRPVEVPVFMLAWTIWGWLSGAGFAVILAIAERRHTLRQVSLGRAALWGAMGAMSAPTVLTIVDLVRLPRAIFHDWRVPVVSAIASVLLGGACAAATLVAARRGI